MLFTAETNKSFMTLPPWIAVIVIIFAVVFIVAFVGWLRTSAARRSGILPPVGKGTMEDVARLIQAGQKIEAIRCYREIHRCGLVEAKKAIEQLSQNLPR